MPTLHRCHICKTVLRRSVVALAIGTLGFAPLANAAGVSWTGSEGAANNFWDLAGNWSGTQVPDAADTAVIAAGFPVEHRSGNNAVLGLTAGNAFRLTGGTLNLASDSVVTGLFTLANGVLAGAGALTAGSLTWNSGTMQGTGITSVAGAATIGNGTSFANVFLSDGRALTLGGNTTFQTNTIQLSNGAALTNSGTLTSRGRVQGASVFSNSIGSTGGSMVFTNTGTFVQDSGAATTNVSIAIANSGTIDVQSGVLSLTGGGTSSGSVVTAAGAVLNFGGGTHTANFSSIAGSGTLRVDGGTTTLTAANYTGTGTLEVAGSGTLVVAGPIAPGPAMLRIGGGILGGTGTVNAAGLAWNGGTMQGTGTATITGAATIGDGVNFSNVFLTDGRVLGLGGSTTFQSNTIQFSNGAALNNSGTFTSRGRVQGASTFDNSMSTTGTPSAIANSGTFVQDSGTATTNVGVAFNSTGTIDVRSGVLSLRGGGASSGNVTTSAGGVLSFGGGAHTANFDSIGGSGTVRVDGGTITLAASSYTGTGTLEVGGSGTLDVVGNVTPGPALLRIGSGGTLGGSGTLTAGSLAWNSGTMQGSGTTTISGAATIGDGMNFSNAFLTGGRVLELRGNTTFQSNTVQFGNGATLDNSGTFTSRGRVQGANVFSNSLSNTGAGSAFNNSGTFVQDAGNATTSVAVVFNSTGTIDVRSGVLSLTGGGTSGGSVTTSAGGVLNFGGGAHTANFNSIGGSGTVRVDAGTTTLATASYTGTGTLEVGGTGTLDIAGSVGPGPAVLRMGSGGTLGGTGTVNAASLAWNSGTMRGAGTTVIHGSATIGDGINFGNAFLTDGRTLDLQGDTTFQSNTIQFSGGATLNNTGTFTSLGRMQGSSVSNNSLASTGAGTPRVFTTLRTYVQSSGLATTSITVTFRNSGELRIDSGLLVFGSAFSLLGNGSILDLPVTALANNNLDINSTAMLDGTLRLDFAFAPTVGQVITVFTYEARNGAFDTIQGTGLGAGFAFNPIYNGSSFQVQVAAIPEPETYAMMLVGLCAVAWARRARRRSRGLRPSSRCAD